MLDKILEFIDEEELLRADGFDSAIIGLDDRSMRLIYSKSFCINIIINSII